jgi:hypothetical protein
MMPGYHYNGDRDNPAEWTLADQPEWVQEKVRAAKKRAELIVVSPAKDAGLAVS